MLSTPHFSAQTYTHTCKTGLYSKLLEQF